MWKLMKRLLLVGSVSTLGPPVAALAVETEQALTITTVGVKFSPREIFAVQDDLTQAFGLHAVGMVDGNEIALDGSEALIYMYGHDAEAMFAVALPILKSHHATASGRAMLRFGGVADKGARIDIRLINDPQWNQ